MTVRLTSLVLLVALGVGCEQGSPGPGTAEPQGGAPAAGGSSQPADAPLAQPGSPPAAAIASRAPVEAPKPQFREVTIPAGTALNLTLATAVGSDTSNVQDTVRAKVAKPIVIDGVPAVPEGAEVVGTVTEAERSGRVKGRASIGLRFHRLTAWNETHDIATARISRQAAATKGEDATKIGIGAGAGALIGGIAGGKKGAAVGGAVGAGAGTGVVVATRGDEVRLPAGASVRTTLQEPLTVRVPIE